MTQLPERPGTESATRETVGVGQLPERPPCAHTRGVCMRLCDPIASFRPDLLMHKNKIWPLYSSCLCYDDVVPVTVLAAHTRDSGCACTERVCVQVNAWGLHPQPHCELDLGTGNCSSLVLSDQGGRNPLCTGDPPTCPLLKHLLHLTSIISVVLL